jgi:hypothetical protein
MPFWSKVKKATGATVHAVGESARKAKSKMDENGLQSQLTNAHAELGQATFELMRVGALHNAALDATFDEIRRLKLDLDKLRADRAAEAKPSQCANCKAALPPDAAFCTACGTKVAAAPPGDAAGA